MNTIHPKTLQSLDPRISRAGIPTEQETPFEAPEELDQFETWEVFHMAKRGERAEHVGSLHAPNAEMALVLAKEQYGRRSRTVSIWVVRTSDVHAITVDDADIFETTPEKLHREARGFRVGTRLTEFKRSRQAESGESAKEGEA